MNDAEAPLVRPVDDEYALWDAAYVLGSLSCADRREFEEHLNTCASCRPAVDELCGLPGLLRRLSLDDMWVLDEGPARGAQDIASIDPHGLNDLLVQASRRRRRSRMLAWMVAAAAAAVLVIGVFVACQASVAQNRQPMDTPHSPDGAITQQASSSQFR